MRSRYRCSMCPAIHITSRSWLRSSSTHEPSDPPLRVVSLSTKLWAAPYQHDFVRPKTTRAVSVGRQASDSNRTNAYVQKKWLRGDVHLPSPHVGTALRTAAPTIRTTTTGGGSLNLRKVADPKGARDPLTARPTITDNRPRDRYPEVATGIQ